MESTTTADDKRILLPRGSKPDVEYNRQISVDSATFFEAEDLYGDYGDFEAGSWGSGGGGGSKKTNKREFNRGGGMTNVYSSKHTRMKEAQRKNQTKTPKQRYR
mmetsp:Transcript_18853/g.27877  ORF Transcript_18853/g.27877 Transcript_18853/m.27877 type:complete len:104 (+) Transcript_18853:128-439(+)